MLTELWIGCLISEFVVFNFCTGTTAESFKHGGRGEFLNVQFSTSPTKGSGLLDKLNWAGLSFGEVKGIKMLTWDSGVELGA